MTYVIRNVLETFSDSRLKRFCFHTTSVFSALKVLTKMRYINLHLTLILTLTDIAQTDHSVSLSTML